MDKLKIFIYWTGNKYNLIKIFHKLLELHCEKNGYELHILTPENIKEYIRIPNYFFNMLPAHQADYSRINLIKKYGGIWLDSDNLMISDFGFYEKILIDNNGFFQYQKDISIGFFGSIKETDVMREWSDRSVKILDKRKGLINWSDIGTNLIMSIKKDHPEFFNNYILLNALETTYTTTWNNCLNEFVLKDYDNYKNHIKDNQSLLVLVNSVYKYLEKYKIEEIINNNMPLNYFIDKSINNLGLTRKDIIEML